VCASGAAKDGRWDYKSESGDGDEQDQPPDGTAVEAIRCAHDFSLSFPRVSSWERYPEMFVTCSSLTSTSVVNAARPGGFTLQA